MEQDDEKIILVTLESLQEFTKFSVPSTLFLKYFFLFFSASLTFKEAAKCIIVFIL